MEQREIEKKDSVVEPEKEGQCQGCRRKSTPRDKELERQLQNRIVRMIGQMNGIGKMLEENRYCGDILTQVAAVESALQNFGYLLLDDHMKTCVSEKIKQGDGEALQEALLLIRKLK